jgi:hypothetical protein
MGRVNKKDLMAKETNNPPEEILAALQNLLARLANVKSQAEQKEISEEFDRMLGGMGEESGEHV